jgi:hypothetical protein
VTGTLVLDSEGLSRYLREDRETVALLKAAHKHGIRVLVSAATIVEADPRGTHAARMSWALSRLVVEPVTKEIATKAVQLLKGAGGLSGHKYAIDAMVTATALAAARPVKILTSDPQDIEILLGEDEIKKKSITVVPV